MLAPEEPGFAPTGLIRESAITVPSGVRIRKKGMPAFASAYFSYNSWAPGFSRFLFPGDSAMVRCRITYERSNRDLHSGFAIRVSNLWHHLHQDAWKRIMTFL